MKRFGLFVCTLVVVFSLLPGAAAFAQDAAEPVQAEPASDDPYEPAAVAIASTSTSAGCSSATTPWTS
jgi:hypothetical protein